MHTPTHTHPMYFVHCVKPVLTHITLTGVAFQLLPSPGCSPEHLNQKPWESDIPRHQSILKHSRQFQCEAQVEIHPAMQRRGTKANPRCGPWVNSICIPRELVGPVQSQALSRLLNRLCCYVHWDLCAHSNLRN